MRTGGLARPRDGARVEIRIKINHSPSTQGLGAPTLSGRMVKSGRWNEAEELFIGVVLSV